MLVFRCEQIVVDLFLICNELEFMTSLSESNQADLSQGLDL